MASLAILLLLARISSSIAVSSNYISRTSEQQVIATVAPVIIPDVDGQSAQPFLTSPYGSYAAYLRRAVDSAAGLAGDSCYVQVQQAGGDSVWESDCTPVGGADACDLAFSPVGLELFAGGHSLWDTGLDADPGTLSLDDGGDLSIVGKDGVTVWRASGEPWTGQQCGSPLPTSASSASPSVEALPPPSTTSTKLVTPPAAATLASGTGGTDFSFGDELAPPPADFPAPPPPVDTVPEQPLAPPPADASPDLSLSPPAAYTFPDSPDQPLLAPPPADISPDLPLLAPPPADVSPLYSSPPPFGIPLAPPAGAGEASPDTPFPGATTPPHGEPAGSQGGVPFSAPPPAVGLPHQHGSPHHDLPVGASPPLPVPDTLAPSGHGAGGAAGLPFGQGQGQAQQGQGVFGQQSQLLDGAGHPLEDSAGGRSSGGAVCAVLLAALVTLCFGF